MTSPLKDNQDSEEHDELKDMANKQPGAPTFKRFSLFSMISNEMKKVKNVEMMKKKDENNGILSFRKEKARYKFYKNIIDDKLRSHNNIN